jgi:LPPG:FO 2-phospho-L-lactate transferase
LWRHLIAYLRILVIFATNFNVDHHVAPMSDDAVRATVYTVEGEMEFQQYLVGRRCERTVWRIAVENADLALPNPAFEAALASTALGAIVICPSNPFLSIDPIFAHGRGAHPNCAKSSTRSHRAGAQPEGAYD